MKTTYLRQQLNALCICFMLGFLTHSGTVFASSESDSQAIPLNITVKWGDYKTFTDVKSANESRKKFAERTFRSIDKYLVKLAQDLPQGHVLNIDVTNLDLAGRVLPGSFVGLGLHSAEDIRLIKQIDIPRIAFSYTYVDAAGNVLSSDTVELKDMSFISGHNPLFSSDSLKYEKNMLRKWFKKNFTV